MIPLDDWLPQAQRKLVGGRRSARGNHSCGDPGSLQISKDGSEWRAYCHRCGEAGFFREQEAPAQKLERLQKQAVAEHYARRTIELPPCTSDDPATWPEKDKLWFYRMGISPRRMKELGLYWNAEMRRVVLPIYDEGRVVFWMARSQLVMPKWIGPVAQKRGLAARYGGGGGYVVLTEDPLSAYKVGLVCEAWSLLGTKLHARHVIALLRRKCEVIVWLDDDRGRKNGSNPGQEAAAEIAAELRAAGIVVHNMKSERDPKYYSQYQIKEMLDANLLSSGRDGVQGGRR